MNCSCNKTQVEIGQHAAECPQRQAQERYWREWAKRHADGVMGQPEPTTPSPCISAPRPLEMIDTNAIAAAQEEALAGLDDGWQPPVASGMWTKTHELEDGAWYQSAATPLAVCVSRCREEDGMRWVHVSVSHPTRVPKYRELVAIKRWALGTDAMAYQVFASDSKHVNFHKFCLHLWSCLDGNPLPDFTHGVGMI